MLENVHNDFYSKHTDLFIYVGIVVYDRYRQNIYLYIGYIFLFKTHKKLQLSLLLLLLDNLRFHRFLLFE